MKKNDEIKKMTPSQILVMSFIIIIVIGTTLLMLPIATRDGMGNEFITALFTATSAVAVTGLSVIDISKEFTVFGQIVVLVLIQLGGLGIMTFSSLVMLLIGKRISYDQKVIIKEGLNQDSLNGIMRFVKNLIKIVLIIEGIGAALLTAGFMAKFPLNQAVYLGIFHSISAFCNAGFALFPDNLISFSDNYIILYTISFLIITGGIGFGVIAAVIEYFKSRKNKMSITSKVALKITGLLLLFGTILIFLIEQSNFNTLGKMSFSQQIAAAFFQSVTTRTAGFNSIDLASMKPATVFVFLFLMFIGASPGSTGGGVKTTTFGVILYSVIATIKNKRNVELENRSIPWEVINRAFSILIISLTYITIVSGAIILFEEREIVPVLFEVISAFATVGLSLGITSSLTVFSKLLIIVTMFIGRVGALTVVLALSEESVVAKYKYPEENIMVG